MGRCAVTMARFVRFNIVGAAGIAVQLGTMWTLVHAAGVHYLIAAPFSVGAALAHNFVWHRCWTWPDRLHSAAGLVRSFAGFVLANGLVSIVGNLMITGALARSRTLSPVPASAAAIVMCGLVNFVLSDRVVFRSASKSYEAVRGTARTSATCAMPATKKPTNQA
jgi:putative flippase GtrA